MQEIVESGILHLEESEHDLAAAPQEDSNMSKSVVLRQSITATLRSAFDFPLTLTATSTVSIQTHPKARYQITPHIAIASKFLDERSNQLIIIRCQLHLRLDPALLRLPSLFKMSI